MSRDSSRKPSGSSTHSGAHSPTTSPTNPHSNRRVTPTTTGNMLSVGVSGSNGLMGYNSGWQVWGSDSPSSRRNPSISSVTSGNDLPPSQSDSGYRGNLREGWSSSRPASGTWDDEVGHSPHTNDFSQLEPQAPLNLHSSRQRPSQTASFSSARVDNRSTKLSPQRYDHGHSIGKESNTTRYNPAASPTAPFVTASTYTGSQPGIQQPVSNVAGGYDTLQAPSGVDELSLSIRGMAVEDDFNVNRQQSQGSHQMASTQPPRPLPMSQPRAPYGSYTGYYPTGGRDSYADYSYGYTPPTDPSLYGSPALSNAAAANLYPSVAPQGLLPTPVTDIHRQQPNIFYDYGPTRPPGSQYYYPAHQAMIFPAPQSMGPSQIPTAIATTMDKKREISYNLQQQQLLAQNMMFGPMRSSPSPHSQAFTSAMDYGQVSLVMPGASMYGPGLQALQMFPPNLRPGRRDGRDTGISLRSPILDEFRANKSRNWELRDIFGHVVEFSGDQHGSRFIQQKLESASSDEKQKVFDEIVPDNTLQLIQDVFGNYVIQKVFEHGTQVQKTRLASGMEGHILALSLQMYGCRVVQKAIEFILPDQQAAFVRELDPHIMKCVRDANGNHVIQKIIERVSPDRLGFVHTFRGSVHELATHPYGCRVLQRSLEHLPEEMIAPLLEELHKSTIALMQDQFGNYVIQFILEHGRPHDRALVIAKLRGQLLHMARHKFASNVCEKALTSADPDTRRMLVDEIITPKYEGLTPIVSMMKDQFANYVLQRAVVVAEPEQKEALISQIRPQLAAMRRYSNAYSKHLVSIERLIEKYSPPSQPVAIMPPELIP